MAEVDASIPLSVKPIQLDNPMDVQAKAYTLKQLGLQTQTAQQEFDDSQKIRSIYAQNIDPSTGAFNQAGFTKDGYAAGLGQKVDAVNSLHLKNQQTQSEIGKNNADATKATAEAGQADSVTANNQYKLADDKLTDVNNRLYSLISNPSVTRQDAIDAANSLTDDHKLTPQQRDQMIQAIPQNQAEVRPWLIRKGLETQEVQKQLAARQAMAPKIEYQDTGPTKVGIDMNPLSPGYNPPASIAKGPTPDEAAKLKFQQSGGGLTHDAMEQAYQQFKTTGELPNSGKGGAAQQAAYANYFAKRAQDDGDTGAAQAARRVQFHASAGVVHDFESGQTSKDLTAINTSIKHVQVLEPLIDSLSNTDSRFVNTVKNAFSTQFGGTAPTDFNGVRDFVTGEISKAVLPGGGGERERDDIKDAAKSAATPAQLKSIVSQWEELLAGKTDAIRNKWDVGTGGNQGSFDKFLLPETKTALVRHGLTQPSAPATSGGAPPAGAAAAAPSGARPPLDSIFK